MHGTEFLQLHIVHFRTESSYIFIKSRIIVHIPYVYNIAVYNLDDASRLKMNALHRCAADRTRLDTARLGRERTENVIAGWFGSS